MKGYSSPRVSGKLFSAKAKVRSLGQKYPQEKAIGNPL